jgi:outer membrane protein
MFKLQIPKKSGKFLTLCLLLNSVFSMAQETWSLERCVMQAQENSRLVKQSQIQVKNAKLLQKQNEYERYPSVSANSNLGFNFGRSVNPSTYTFENSSTNYNSWGLNARATVYNGGRINNQIKQGALDIQAAQADLEQSASTIGLQVAQAYLQILLYDEQLENAKKRLQTAQSQLDRTEKQIKAGQLAPTARYELIAQVARDEQAIVTASNNVEIGTLNLKNLLELSPEMAFKIEKPSIILPSDANPDGFMFRAVYNQALTTQPQIKAAEYRIKSAEMGVKVAEANLLPSLSINGSLGSNYSSTILDYTKGTVETREVSRPAKVNNVPVTITESVRDIINAPKKGYSSQLGNNFGQGIGLNLSIPIFEGFRNKIGVQRQKLNVESQMLTLDREKQTLKSDVLTAIANAKAAKKQFEAAQKSYEAQKAAFEAVDKRLQIGNANGFELTVAKNNMDTAQGDVTVAKYDYLFRLKIVEFYEGKKLSLK